MTDLVLSEFELRRLTGYKRPADQVRELLRQGFYRARQAAVTGNAVLERAHYDAVCAGEKAAKEPKLRPYLRAV